MTVGLGLLFASVSDPRAPNARHALSDLLFIAFAAMPCGAGTCVDTADFARCKRSLLAEVLGFTHGVPGHDTFGRVFRLLGPPAFEAASCAFMGRFAAAVSGQVGAAGQVVALDGKSLRGAVDAARRSTPLHMVAAWAAEQRLVLAVRRAPERSEVAAAREAIGLLDLTAATVTADALHGSRATAKAIRGRGGGYAFAGLAAAARIDCLRRVGDKEERRTRCVALSRVLGPAEALRVVRTHWSIENNRHWLLDVAFGEDRIATRHDNTGENLAMLRRLAPNLVRTDAYNASIRRKIKRAGWDSPYLLTLLRQRR